MKRFLAAVAAALIGGTACSAAAAPAPAYQVVKKKGSSVDLLVENATVDSAKAAITDWLSRNVGDADHLYVTVVRSADAATYVCQGEYVATAEASQIKTGGRVTGDFPVTAFNCPNP